MELQDGTKIIVDHKNKRLKLFDLDHNDRTLTLIEEKAKKEELNKIILFQKNIDEITEFNDYGYTEEGKIDGFFDGESAVLLTKYLSDERKNTDSLIEENKILSTIETNKLTEPENYNLINYRLRKANDNDVEEIVSVFKQVFITYPTPIDNEDYILNAINSNVEMAIIENEKKNIVGISSAEIDYGRNNAEITDCATLPSERGKGLMNHLIRHLEQTLVDKGIDNLYSIARAQSFGMNKVLYNLNYNYRGRLINNVHIAGNWENMNIWVKQLN